MSRAVNLGRWLFRMRSFTPLPVIGAVLAALVLRPAANVPHPNALIALGCLACALGQALRAWVLGTVPHGTSGQDAYLEAVSLNTSGPYAHVRNPLYVGNFAICLGLALVSANPTADAIGMGFFALQYAFVVAAEEDFLRGRFGPEFDRYCASVPRWRWRWRAVDSASRDRGRFDWRRALRKEHNPFCAWASGLVALAALRAQHSPRTLMALAAIEVSLLFAFVAVKGWKRRWWLAGA